MHAAKRAAMVCCKKCAHTHTRLANSCGQKRDNMFREELPVITLHSLFKMALESCVELEYIINEPMVYETVWHTPRM